MNNHTAKHFVLQLGSLISLYLSLAFFLVLTFGLINLRFPDPLDSLWQMQTAADNIRIGFAMVVVFFPTYLVLTRIVNKNRRHSNDTSYLGLTKWLIYLSLLVGGLVLLGDFVAVILGFLDGDLTTRFILKALAVFVVTGGAFYYYIRDAQGYWLQREKQSFIYAIVVSVLLCAVLISGLLLIPNPSVVREMEVDQTMVSDLQNIQFGIEDYYRQNQALPESLAVLFTNGQVTTAPAGKPAYTYNVIDGTNYQLCATFNHDVTGTSTVYRADNLTSEPQLKNNYNWFYTAGEYCFDRTITVDFLDGR